MPLKVTRDSKLQWFQLRLVNRILPTNDFLFKIKIVNSPLCSYCEQVPESYGHLFYECYIVKNFLVSLEKWMSDYDLIHEFSLMSMIFGVLGNDSILNLIIILIKQYIYTSKFKKKSLNLNAFKLILNNY